MQKRRYQDLEVWQRAMDLVVATYHYTASYPSDERYGLVSQTRRAEVSIPCNIAEGQGRSRPGEFLNQLSVARGSLQELETLCVLAGRLDYLSDELLTDVLKRSDKISRMLTGLKKALALLAGGGACRVLALQPTTRNPQLATRNPQLATRHPTTTFNSLPGT